MMTHSPILRFVLASIVFVLVLSVPRGSRGTEPVEPFLKGLKKRGYFDLALVYLEELKTSPLVPSDVKTTIPFQQGLMLIAGAEQQRDLGLREKQLNEAQQRLSKFIKENGPHPLATTATSQLGNTLMKRAQLNLSKSENLETGNERNALLKRANDYLTGAGQVFERLENDLRKLLEEMPPHIDVNTEPEKFELRNKYRKEYVQSKMVRAYLLQEKARTVKRGSEAHKQQLNQAVEAFAAIYDKYHLRPAGLLALLYQGRCYQELDDVDQALALFGELLEQTENSPVIRSLKTRALKSALECWSDPSQKKFEPAIERGSAWVKQIRPNEERDANWLALRLALAKTYHAGAKERQVKNRVDPFIKRHITNARFQVKIVARHPGPLQKEARSLLAELGAKAAEDPSSLDPKTFVDAMKAGEEAVQESQSSTFLIRKLQKDLSQQRDPEKRDDLEKEIAEVQMVLDAKHTDALRYFWLAISLADPDTKPEDVGVAYYYLGYLNYVQKNYYDAVVYAEQLARRDPDSPSARSSAKIAMAAYVQLYQQAIADEAMDTEFAISHIKDIGQYIAITWPGQTETDEALMILIDFGVQADDLEEIQKYLGMFDPTSPRRGEAELKVGQKLWRKYLRDMRNLNDTESAETDRTPQQLDAARLQLDQLKARAKTTLADGIQRMSKGEMNETLAYAAIALAQIHLDTGETKECIDLLQHPRIGALELVKKKHAVAKAPAFAVETYKTSLRAHISSLPDASSDEERVAVMEKALDLMDALESAVSETKEGKRKLIGVYVSLARDVEEQIRLASPEKKDTLSDGFKSFLTRVIESTNDARVLNWVAEMFFSLGSSLDTQQGPSDDKPRQFYHLAIITYQKVLDQDTGDQSLDSDLVIHVRMRMATTKRRIGRYKEAINLFEAILKEKNRALDVQVEAALTYQEWAAAKSARIYEGAIFGGRRDKKTKRNTIWGWGKVAKMAGIVMRQNPQNKEKYGNTMHQARYNLALCHYRWAMKKTGNERTTELQRAKRTITRTVSWFADMGGPDWRPKYNSLLVQIQKRLGEDPVGLRGTTKSKLSRTGG